jgi:hypothetical protein
MKGDFGLEPKVRQYPLAGHMKSHVVSAALFIENRHRTRSVDQDEIAGGELYQAAIVIEGRAAPQLKDYGVTLDPIEAGVPPRTVYPRNIAARIDGAKSIDTEAMKPALENIRIDPGQVVRTTRGQQRTPFLAG